jgi:hypothetical protein
MQLSFIAQGQTWTLPWNSPNTSILYVQMMDILLQFEN